jgi:hypothetical protein
MRRAVIAFCIAVGGLAVPANALAGAPTATTGVASAVTGTTATVSGTVFANKEETTYHFEFGKTTSYGTSSPTGTANGNSGRTVAADLSGLQPQTTYHFRLVATNASGTATGSDATFTTTTGGPAGPPAVTIAATPKTVKFGSRVTIAGQVTGNPAVAVELDALPYPFSGPFSKIVEGETNAAAEYSFFDIPSVNTRYHVSAKASPTVESADITVNVSPRVGLRLSDTTPARGQRVRFRGSVVPAHDGATVRIQRKTSSGWRTVKSAVLATSTPVGGDSRSKYSAGIRVRHSGAYRTVLPKHADHARGKSRKRQATVH